MLQIHACAGQQLTLILTDDFLTQKGLHITDILKKHDLSAFQRSAVHHGYQCPKGSFFLKGGNIYEIVDFIDHGYL